MNQTKKDKKPHKFVIRKQKIENFQSFYVISLSIQIFN